MPRAVLLTPPTSHPHELAVLTAISAAGLPALHVRKPGWDRRRVAAYVRALPPAARAAAVLHDWHDLAAELGCKASGEGVGEEGGNWGLGGAGARRAGAAPPRRAPATHSPPTPLARLSQGVHYTERLRQAGAPPPAPGLTASASLHTLAAIPPAGPPCLYSYAFLSPIFDSISKQGYVAAFDAADLAAALGAPRECDLIALGGVTPATARAALGLGFDGVAVLGAVWEAADPVAAWEEVLQAVQ